MRSLLRIETWRRLLRSTVGTWRGLGAVHPVPEEMRSETEVVRLRPKRFNGYFSDAA